MLKKAMDYLKEKESELKELAKSIWENPELGYREEMAAKVFADFLEKEGFTVERSYGGIKTAVRASFGNGHPVVGLLAEYDALPELSQKVQATQEPVEAGAAGHGCGHNLIGVSCLGTAIALKKGIEEEPDNGTIVIYGCPAEELLTGKGFMAREGAFQELDFALAYHPGSFNNVIFGTMTALNTMKFRFNGKTAHAAMDPQNGRSALDAVELMNVGVNFLREHVTSDVRIHYVISNGGLAPNIVPDFAESHYFIRALKLDTVAEVKERIRKIGEGAALMTETTFEMEDLGGCYDILTNQVLADQVYESMKEVEMPVFDDEDNAFAQIMNEQTPNYTKLLSSGAIQEGVPIHVEIYPRAVNNLYASSDVGDVSYITPTVMFFTASYNIGAPGHSWQAVACSGNEIGFKGMLYGSRVMIQTFDKIRKNPEILVKAKEEFAQAMKGKRYTPQIPEDAKVPYSDKQNR